MTLKEDYESKLDIKNELEWIYVVQKSRVESLLSKEKLNNMILPETTQNIDLLLKIISHISESEDKDGTSLEEHYNMLLLSDHEIASDQELDGNLKSRN